MDLTKLAVAVRGLGIAAVIAVAPPSVGSAPAQNRPILHCELGQIEAEPAGQEDFKIACGYAKDAVLAVVKWGTNAALVCDEKSTSEVLRLIQAAQGLLGVIEEKRDEGKQLGIEFDKKGQEWPFGLWGKLEGYAKMAIDMQAGLAEASLVVGDTALSENCLPLADALFRYVLRAYPQARFAAARQRAQVGIDDVRGKTR